MTADPPQVQRLPTAADYRPGVTLSPEQVALGAAMFSSALNVVVRMSHRSLDHGGLLHPSPRAARGSWRNCPIPRPCACRFDQLMFLLRGNCRHGIAGRPGRRADGNGNRQGLEAGRRAY